MIPIPEETRAKILNDYRRRIEKQAAQSVLNCKNQSVRKQFDSDSKAFKKCAARLHGLIEKYYDTLATDLGIVLSVIPVHGTDGKVLHMPGVSQAIRHLDHITDILEILENLPLRQVHKWSVKEVRGPVFASVVGAIVRLWHAGTIAELPEKDEVVEYCHRLAIDALDTISVDRIRMFFDDNSLYRKGDYKS